MKLICIHNYEFVKNIPDAWESSNLCVAVFYCKKCGKRETVILPIDHDAVGSKIEQVGEWKRY